MNASLVDEIVSRGVAEVFPEKESVRRTLLQEPLRVYLGIDPTAPSLHIGHLIGLQKLRQFQNAGHQVILLIGDFTARIGDPTDKLSARIPLTKEEIKKNLKKYRAQAAHYLRFSGKNKAQVMFNARWLEKMKLKDVIELASLVTVDQLGKRDMFVARADAGKPVYLHEFLYPILQGYDSVALGVDGEIGGTDQTFNMLMGRTLLKHIKGKEKFVLTLKLLEGGEGKKMGKTDGNAVWLSDEPEAMYGKIMSWADEVVAPALELCTSLSPEECQNILALHPRDRKMRLAFEIVRAVYETKTATIAEGQFVTLFQKRAIPENLPEYRAPGTLSAFLIEKGFVSSLGEARRLADAGAIENISQEKRLGWEEVHRKTKAAPGVYRVGKSKYFKIS